MDRVRKDMKDKEQVLKALRLLKDEIGSRFKVREMYLFGSFIRDERNHTSDVDLIVELHESADLIDLVSLGQFLEAHLKRRVDLGTKRSLRREMKEHVFKEMVAI